MHYIQAQPNRIIPWDEAFPDHQFGEHGKDKVGFGSDENSVDNPTAICGSYDTGGKMLEEVGFNAGNRLGFYNIVLVLADKAWAKPDDTDCHIVGVMRYVEGRAGARISGFVNVGGDPQPRKVRDGSNPNAYEVDRAAKHLPWKRYYYHIYYLTEWGDTPRPALVLEVNGHTPKTDMTFPEPAVAGTYCQHCGKLV